MGREEEEDGQTQTPGEEKEIADGSEQRRRKRAEGETAIRVSSSFQQTTA